MGRITQPDANASLRDEWDETKIHDERSAIYVHYSIEQKSTIYDKVSEDWRMRSIVGMQAVVRAVQIDARDQVAEKVVPEEVAPKAIAFQAKILTVKSKK